MYIYIYVYIYIIIYTYIYIHYRKILENIEKDGSCGRVGCWALNYVFGYALGASSLSNVPKLYIDAAHKKQQQRSSRGATAASFFNS